MNHVNQCVVDCITRKEGNQECEGDGRIQSLLEGLSTHIHHLQTATNHKQALRKDHQVVGGVGSVITTLGWGSCLKAASVVKSQPPPSVTRGISKHCPLR
jgi:hypothetical protein